MRACIAACLLLLSPVALGACPELPDKKAGRISTQRTYLAALAKHPNSIFAYADCAAQWAPGAVDAGSISDDLERPTWLLAKDIADVLRRAAESANASNASVIEVHGGCWDDQC